MDAELKPTDVVLDLYCGTGSIGLTLASRCREVVGIEISASAVRDARRNAERNGITNARFVGGDVSTAAELHGGEEARILRPDVVIVDPARQAS
jgi:23S rRNA (uracil1939-C5)-methyltransferase